MVDCANSNPNHWLFEETRSQEYNAEAAGLAWQRTVELLKQHLQEQDGRAK